MKTTVEEKNQIARINRRLRAHEYLNTHKVQVARSATRINRFGRFILVDTFLEGEIDWDNNLDALTSRFSEWEVA